MPYANYNQVLEYQKKYRATHQESLALRKKNYQAEHTEHRRAYQREWVHTHPEHRIKQAERSKKDHYQMKMAVLTHYGNGKATCVKCNFEDVRALVIDHVNDDGIDQRKRFGVRSGVYFYRWLIKNNYPEGYQTLCRNCNWIKKREADDAH